MSGAVPGMLQLFGDPLYFANGDVVPAGTYRFTYLDGCMKYSDSQSWTVNAYATGTYATWQVIGDDPGVFLGTLPGKSDYSTGGGADSDFEACVDEGKTMPPLDVVFATPSKIGVRLSDSPVTDNAAGLNGRNPTWRLTKVDCGP
ncbi:MAG: hypothetical protein IT374_03345 [Polyangiaceae bacterium]|nr:hypothetical protein [Polyangiaceae bacterium]